MKDRMNMGRNGYNALFEKREKTMMPRRQNPDRHCYIKGIFFYREENNAVADAMPCHVIHPPLSFTSSFILYPSLS